MVKVRTSQIPEEDGAPQYQSSENSQKEDKRTWIDFSQDGEKEHYNKMVVIDNEFIMPVKEIVSVEKTQRIKQSDYNADDIVVQFGLIINKNIKQDTYHPRVDIEFWYSTEELRDQRFNSMIDVLKDENFKFINI